MSRRFFHLVNDLHSLKFITSSITDKGKFQCVFGKQEVPRNKYEFLEFHMSVLMNLLVLILGLALSTRTLECL